MISKRTIILVVMGVLLLFLSFLLDNTLANYPPSLRSEYLNPLFIFLGAQLGLALFLIILLILYNHYQKKDHFLTLLLSIITATAISILLKYLIARKRPDLLPLIIKDSYSFPSSHAAIAAATIPFIAGLKSNLKYIKIPLFIIAITIILTGFYNGVHYISDVVAGVILGVTIAFIIQKYLPPIINQKK